MKAVVITGASGFIGSHLSSAFSKGGFRVIGLCRRATPAASNGSVTFASFRLGERLEHKGDVLVHCAHDMSPPDEYFNVRSSERLFAEARALGFERIIYISSIAARPEARSRYGREKFRIESALDSKRDLALRPGLVVGTGGLFSAMATTIRRFGIAPIFEGGIQPVYTIGIKDLASAVLRLEQIGCVGIVTIASPEPTAMRDIYVKIGRRYKRSVALVPMPYALTLAATLVSERIGLRLPVTSETLRGLQNLGPVSLSPLEALGISVRSLDSALDELPA